ncbi:MULTISPECIES: hypothetical protein [unclassified Marinobacterium]|uniref:hypothetical protein n=1 Tax=unclassified Marinobacterium TaxID=2644139 RepID=UPI0015680206|nr:MULTISPECIES: hypothetical protein [unclassified Marinobacterium]NRP09030.1 hypothetical protein [Marinobacterium sp. xm-g-48]NRP82439.1 hypothetical protein [Marinobacterium sp. xm-d-509]
MALKDDLRDAFERLKKNGGVVNLASVAREAGRQRSIFRKGRGYDDLIEEISIYSADMQSADKKVSSRNQRKSDNDASYIASLEKENNMLKSQNISLLYRLYTLEAQMRDLDVKPNPLATVTDISERFEGIDFDKAENREAENDKQ